MPSKPPKSIVDYPLNFGSRDWCTTLEYRALFLGYLLPIFMDHVKSLSYCSHWHWQSMAIENSYLKKYIRNIMVNLGTLADRIGREVCFSQWVFFFIEKVLFKSSLELKILEGIKNEDPSEATNPWTDAYYHEFNLKVTIDVVSFACLQASLTTGSTQGQLERLQASWVSSGPRWWFGRSQLLAGQWRETKGVMMWFHMILFLNPEKVCFSMHKKAPHAIHSILTFHLERRTWIRRRCSGQRLFGVWNLPGG